MTIRILKPICQVAVSVLPRRSVARRILESRVLKFRFIKFIFRSECPLVRLQFADGTWRSARCFILGSSHVIYGLDPQGMVRKAWNMGISNCDLRTMYYIVKMILDAVRIPDIVICVDYWMRSLQTEYTRDFAVLCTLNSLGIVPLRNGFMSRYWGKFESMIPGGVPDGLQFRDGYFAGRQHWSGDVEGRVDTHMKFMRLKPSELIWLERTLDLCESHGVKPLVVFPPARKDYRDYIPSGTDLFSEYRCICARRNIDVIDWFADPEYGDVDFGDADHLNERGALKFARRIEMVLQEREKSLKGGIL